jgi:sec-independent protein translocase protein TatB
MPSLGDSIFIFVLALMLVGPKNLPKLARQLGKLMAEFRRASNEFRMQMEDELRVEEQKEHQAKVAAMPGPPSTLPDPEHPHLPAPAPDFDETPAVDTTPMPIAESGELKMMPPSTGLPVQSGSYGATPHVSPEVAAVESIQVPEHTIHQTSAGISSEEPAAEASENTHA